MQTSFLFTVGIAFRNPGKAFELAVRSVFAQTCEDWELLLVDDGSTDGSVEFAEALDDPRVRVLVDGQHRNLNHRLNQMVREARAPYFVRMDADDVMHPCRLEKQLRVMLEHGDDVVMGTSCYCIDSQSRIIGQRSVPKRQGVGFAAWHSFTHSTVCAHTAWFRANPYSEEYIYHRSQDAELWCRTSKESKFVWLDEPLLYYREGDSFSMANCLGTSLGVIYLTTEYCGSRLEFAAILTREVVKCWLTCLLFGFGRVKWITDRRYRAVPEQVRSIGERDLARVFSTELPVKRCVLSQRSC